MGNRSSNDLPIDAIDTAILARLQEDGRMPNAALADAVKLTPSPCLRRLKRLQDGGVIEGYRAILSRPAVGLGLTVFVQIKVERHSDGSGTALADALTQLDEVLACHVISGEADFLVEIVVTDLEHYERLLFDTLLQLPGVADLRSNVAIRTLKASGALPLGHLDARPRSPRGSPRG